MKLIPEGLKAPSIRTLPAVALTAVSMALTLAVVGMWLGQYMPLALALLVGAGLDGAWLAVNAYERRLAAQGDHSRAVTAIGWFFGVVAAGILVAHAFNTEGTAAWLAVSWLPLAAKALWFVHGLWERTALTPDALGQIRAVRQDARDRTAVDRARLLALALTEETRLDAVASAGASVAKARSRAARKLDKARGKLGSAPEAAAVPVGWALPELATVPALEPANTAELAAEHDDQADELPANVVELTRPNTGEHAPNISDLAREQVAAGVGTTQAVAAILAKVPDAKPDSVAATFRRERRKADASPYR